MTYQMTYTDTQVKTAIDAFTRFRCDRAAEMLNSLLADRQRLQAEVQQLNRQIEAESIVSNSYFDQIAELQAEVQLPEDIVARFKLAAKTIVRDREVFGEDVETLVDVLRALESFAAPQPPEGVRVVDDGLYYLQDSRIYIGNCPTWWAKGRAGYTSKLDEAHRFTLAEAMRQYRERDTDIPWLCAEVDTLARLTVDMQHMRSISAQRDRLAAPTLAGKED